jgi:hypothetical protein
MAPVPERTAPTFCAAALAACGGIDPPGNTGGVDVPVREGCGRGVVVVSSDYQSSNVSLIDFEGRTLSESVVSSASVAPGLSAALSGDVVAPTQAADDEITLIDRYPAGVITWVDVETGSVRAQLNVGTGFIANPHDYAVVSPERAFVTRFEANADSGQEAYDAGSDVLVVDPSEPAVTGRIDLADAFQGEPDFLPRPDRALLVDSSLLVLLGGYAPDFERAADARIVVIDVEGEAVTDSLTFPGVTGCSALALSPSGQRVAVACAGTFGGDSVSSLEDSALVVVRLGSPPSVEAVVPALSFAGAPIGWGIDWASEQRLFVVTWGHLDDNGEAAEPDRAFELDWESGTARELASTVSTPFAFGEVRCMPACGACFLADAETRGGVVQRFPIGRGGVLGAPEAFEVEGVIGLPPRYLGRF